jgi:tetratricopeptide (TPR) repeat protein
LQSLSRIKYPGIITIIVVVLAVSLSCSTKKNTWSRRVYHNLTAHYNAYFNGNESYKEGVAQLAIKNKDNFVKVIPVFPYGTKADAQSVYAQLDRAIEKGAKVISKHSIYIKRVEHVKWIDDAYMLIGKSYLYKQEYDLAVQTFNFIRERYKGNPIINDALLYEVRAYNQMGKFTEAEGLLGLVEKKVEKNKATRHIEKMFPLVMADLYIQQEDYGKSIEFLEQGIRLNKNKKIRTRLSFILAQVFQRTGNLDKATEYYKKVLGYNPVYEMEFAAKINMAKCYNVAAGDSREIIKQLQKMLRDEKNKDFLDQIYYALAEVYLKDNKTKEGIENLKLSARTSVSNNYQKGISYLKLGEIYYDNEDYKPAQTFYDSAVLSLPKDYPNFSQIESKKNTLTDLVTNLNVVELEDSLQKLGRMPYAERIQKIDDIIMSIIKEEERKKQEEIDRQMALNNLQQMGFQDNTNSGGKWYFDNPQTMSFGFTEFKKKWGDRKLEDLWRLSSKVTVDFDNNENAQQGDSANADSSKAYVFDPKDRNAYLKAIPTTPDAFAASDRKIEEALFNIGVIYKNGLSDYDKSIATFEKLFSRFPDSKYSLQAYYYLYRIYTENEDPAKANQYKDLILTRYPDSDYAKIIMDPDYYQKIDSIKGLEEVYYGITYQAYQDGQYKVVISNADSASHSFKDKNVISKFCYLRAVSVGKLYGDSLMIEPLKEIVAKYPSSAVVPLAQALLNYLIGPSAAANNASITDTSGKIPKNNTAESPYVYDPEGFHFYISVFDAVKVKIAEVKNLYSDHNTAMFKLEKLTVNSMFLNNNLQMITINKFDNKIKALDYYTSVGNNSVIMAKLGPANIKHFVISANNYTTFFRLKDVQQYLDFFNANYLDQ